MIKRRASKIVVNIINHCQLHVCFDQNIFNYIFNIDSKTTNQICFDENVGMNKVYHPQVTMVIYNLLMLQFCTDILIIIIVWSAETYKLNWEKLLQYHACLGLAEVCTIAKHFSWKRWQTWRATVVSFGRTRPLAMGHGHYGTHWYVLIRFIASEWALNKKEYTLLCH